MSIKYLYKTNDLEISDGQKLLVEKEIYHGDKGLTMKYYGKNNTDIEKVVVKKLEDNKFILKVSKNKDAPVETEVSKSALMKELKDKKFSFMTDFLKDNKDTLSRMSHMSRPVKTSKKSSKKSSKKAKTSKKAKASKKA